VTPTEQNATTPSRTTGFFAVLGGLLRGEGTGASILSVKGTAAPCSALGAPKGYQGASTALTRTATPSRRSLARPTLATASCDPQLDLIDCGTLPFEQAVRTLPPAPRKPDDALSVTAGSGRKTSWSLEIDLLLARVRASGRSFSWQRSGVSSSRPVPFLFAGLAMFFLLVVFSWLASPAQAARGHVFSKSFGEQCSAEPCEGAKLKEPSGVAVNEATGDVYVVDKGEAGTHGRVVRFNSAGVFQSELSGPSTTGKGTVTSGSATIEAVTTTGFFSKGEEIAAVGLAPGTTIVKVGAGTLEVSPAATASGSEPSEPLTAHQPFSEPEGIAVDNACHLHQLTESTKPTCAQFDPSNGDVYVANEGEGQNAIDKFNSTGEYVGQIAETPAGAFSLRPNGLMGVTADTAGELWAFEEIELNHRGADSFTNAVVNEFTAFHKLEGCGSLSPGPGYGVDREQDLYVYGVSICKFSATGKLLEAVDTEKASGVAVELSSDDVYVDNLGVVRRFSAGLEELESLEVPGHNGSGVAVDSSRETVYVADSMAGVVDVYTAELPGPPTVVPATETFSEVTSESAVFVAKLDPHGTASEYTFEYGRCASLEACATSGFPETVPAPEGQLPADYEPHAVSATPQDLLPGSAYHFRVAVHNVHGPTVYGERQSFTTQGVGGEFALPDARAWELVSPPDKHGAELEPIGEEGVIQAAAAGGAISYIANAPTEPHPAGYSNKVQVLSTREPSGWSSKDIAPPNNPVEATGKTVGAGEEYRFFSEDLSAAVVQPLGAFTPCLSPEGASQPCLSEEATEQTAFGRNDTTGAYTPLVTGAAGHANVPLGTHFGEEGKCPEKPICGPLFVGASPDATHVVIGSTVGLTEGEGSKGGLYEWAAGRLTFVGGGVLGGHNGLSARHAVSDDGRVIFEGVAQGKERLLLHDTATPSTVKLDEAEPACLEEPGTKCESGGGHFQIASSDGSRVFFTSTHRLTRDAGAEGGQEGGTEPHKPRPDLYVYEPQAPEGERLTDLTPLHEGEPAGVQGEVLGAGEDGSSVYFVANGVQGDSLGAAHGACEEGRPRKLCNLYLVRREGAAWGRPRLIAVLSQNDAPDWAAGEGVGSEGLPGLTARVSPSGGWLAFMSQRSLTGYDNEDVTSRKPGERVDQEVFLYDAATGGLACASCDPTGARPVGVEYERLNDGLAGGDRVWSRKAWIAGNVPGWTPYRHTLALYQSRYLNNEGRLFFNAHDALVPADVNGQEDVYQYEPAASVPGAPPNDTCTSAPAGSAVVFKPGGKFKDETREGTEPTGCVGLISSGRSSGESAFLDASESGNDVYFLTSERLVPQDTDTSVDVYDAHVCTGESPCFSAPASPPPCTNESSCRPSPTPQPSIFGAPASATFSGPGNLIPEPPPPPAKPTAAQLRAKKLAAALASCRKKKNKHKRQECERAARKKYAAKTSKTSKRKR